MKLERLISWYDKHNNELIGELNIDHVGLEVLKNIFTTNEDDPLMYDPYEILDEEARMLAEYVDMKFDFDQYVYQLECFSVEEK